MQKEMKNEQEKISMRKKAIWIVIVTAVAACLLVAVFWPAISQKADVVLNGDAEVTIAAGEEFVDEGATATVFGGKSANDQIYETGEVDTSTPGTYEINYNVDGRWETFTATRTVTVVDETAPEVSLQGDETVTVDEIGDYIEKGAIATDNCDGNVTASLTTEREKVNDYTYQVTYTASDAAGNEGTAVRTVVLKDTEPPEITLNGDEELTTEEGEPFDDPGVTVVDDRDGDISESAVRSGYIDVYLPGTYTVTYTASDAAGNEAKVKRTVTVKRSSKESESAIYLTFDDGPSTEITPKILDTLAANNIKATFFILNYDEDTLPLIKRMIAEGHTIGIHGYSHDYSKIYTSTDAFMENVYSLQEKLKEDTGYEAFVIRFPGGSSNTVSKKYCSGIMSDLVELVTDEGLMYMDWNVTSTDAGGSGIPAEQLISSVEGGLQKGRSNVVLMHDSSGKTTTPEALKQVIAYGKANGYSFYAITEDTAPVHQNVQN